MEQLTLSPIGDISGVVSLPGSKSLSNRVLLLAALADGRTDVQNLLDSDDIRYMKGALTELGVVHSPVEGVDSSHTVEGCSGLFPNETEGLILDLGNAGTAMRPMSAAVCGASKVGITLDGTKRMRERPIKDLIEALDELGAQITCSDTGCPPVVLSKPGLPGGVAKVSGKISSQYLSALLMAAPLAKESVQIEVVDTLVSVPYVAMTIKLMEQFGVKVENDGFKTFKINAPQTYTPPKGGTVYVEGDASSASYFLAGAAITGGTVTIKGCGSESIQGDVDFARVLGQMGAEVTWTPTSITVTRDPNTPLRGVDVDCGDIPDAAMTLAVVALFAEGKTAIRNVYNWRVKETERMKAIVTELRKLGAQVEEGHDYCVIEPIGAEGIKSTSIDTYDDHRMAMAFSLAACGNVSITINDPKCTAKTFPTYFDELNSLVTKK